MKDFQKKRLKDGIRTAERIEKFLFYNMKPIWLSWFFAWFGKRFVYKVRAIRLSPRKLRIEIYEFGKLLDSMVIFE